MATVHQSVVDEIKRIFALGKNRSPTQCREIIDSLAAYRPLQSLDGAPNTIASNAGLCFVWVFTADAYATLGDLQQAAVAYAKAASFRPSFCFGDDFAELVLTNNLVDHYMPALLNLKGALEIEKRAIVRLPWRLRLIAIWSVMKCPCLCFRAWWGVRSSRVRSWRLKRRLEHRVHGDGISKMHITQ